MRKLHCWSMVIMLVYPGSCAVALDDDAEKLVQGNHAFAVDLYHALPKQDGNLFISPHGISLALAMAYGGARGQTAVEMNRALHIGLPHARLHPAFSQLNQLLLVGARKTGQELNIANGLCLTRGEIGQGFKDGLQEYYDAEFFGGDVEQINRWVTSATEGKITRIVDRLDPAAVCVLLNAVYFQGAWLRPFDAAKTQDAPFTLAKGRQVKVPLMHRKGSYKVLRTKDFEAIAMPYRGRGMSMVVLLPRTARGLPKLEHGLSGPRLRTWLQSLHAQRPEEVDLYLPKFTLETSYGLREPFEELGMRKAFREGTADFTGMGWPEGKLWISQIRHAAFVEVDEEGTEAAAATAASMATFDVTPTFRADHPFLFVIRDHATGSILFMGRLANPAAG